MFSYNHSIVKRSLQVTFKATLFLHVWASFTLFPDMRQGSMLSSTIKKEVAVA